ncbi:MAG: U32 family peptidase C-terminal domain-containing protein, partial [Bifidobacteriaceae bacterium]|nr:U32 family peptidase C-terminal domain-containing protein [Bifidobacteriaceae bacterium]
IEHVDDLIEAGIDSLKIEGRSKSAYYSGVITNAYKTAIKAYYSGKKTPKWANQEVHNVSHRPYSTGFYYSDNMSKGRRNSPWQTYEKGYIRNYQLLANVVKNSKIINKTSRIAVETRNYFKLNSQIEILSPGKVPQTAKIIKILDKNNQNLPFSNKPMVQLNLILDKNLTIPIGSFIRQAL